MGRQFAQIRPDMWLDDDWRALTPRAQHLYLVILTDPALSYAGVTDWKPGRLRQRAAEWPLLDLMIAAQELSAAHFLIFDDETEEVAVRSYLRHDGLLKQPRMAVSMANAFGQIGSNKIRAGIVFELTRLKRETPTLEAWTKPQVMTILKQNSVDPREMITDLPLPLGMDLPLTFPIRSAQTEGDVSLPPTTATAPTTSPSTSSIEEASSKTGSYPQHISPQLVATLHEREAI